MRSHLAPVACGAATALLLYGLLSAAERRLPESQDPWLDAWMADGLKAEFRSTSGEPEKYALSSDVRPLLKGPDFEATVLRTYLVLDTSVQVIRLPKPALLPEIPEGRLLDHRFGADGNPVHVCRSGRTLLLVALGSKGTWGFGFRKLSKGQVEEIFDPFEETARRTP